MNYLFKDLFDEPKKKKKEEQLPPDPIEICPHKIEDQNLGVSCGTFECERCAGKDFEIMAADAGSWQLWCWYCGARQWEQAPEQDTFVFHTGIYKGLTMSQVAAQSGGQRYIEFMSRKASSKAVREKCQSWLDGCPKHP